MLLFFGQHLILIHKDKNEPDKSVIHTMVANGQKNIELILSQKKMMIHSQIVKKGSSL